MVFFKVGVKRYFYSKGYFYFTLEGYWDWNSIYISSNIIFFLTLKEECIFYSKDRVDRRCEIFGKY